MVLKDDGSLWGMGYNPMDNSRDGFLPPRKSQLKSLIRESKMSPQDSHTMVLKDDGASGAWDITPMDNSGWFHSS